MLLSYFTANSNNLPSQTDLTDFGVDIFPTTQTKLTTLSLASNFGV